MKDKAQAMIKKITGKTIVKIKSRLFFDLTRQVAELDSKVDLGLGENNRMLRELILEQHALRESNLSGGHLRISDREVATKIFNGLIMYLDPSDIAITPHIVFTGIWERWVTKAWLSVLRLQKDAVALDIGSNNGYFGALAAHELDSKKSKVVLFEPNPNLIPYIHKTLDVNWLNENAVVEPLAISDSNGSAKLNILKDYVGSSSMHSIEHLESYLQHKMKIRVQEVVNVKTATIDSYCKQNKVENVDVAIMDIEGFEEKAYNGMRNTVKASKNMVLFLEFTKDGYEDPKKFFNLMKNDFGNVYTLVKEGEYEGRIEMPREKSYESLVGKSSEYVMLVFSKRKLA
jgi:FkbM family methyltransferase